jgi:hypothetical protein
VIVATGFVGVVFMLPVSPYSYTTMTICAVTRIINCNVTVSGRTSLGASLFGFGAFTVNGTYLFDFGVFKSSVPPPWAWD